MLSVGQMQFEIFDTSLIYACRGLEVLENYRVCIILSNYLYINLM